jgi:WD40 repeat protein
VQVWDLDTGQPLHTLAGHDGPVAAVAVSADGRRAVSGGGAGTVLAWDLADGKWVAPASQRLRRRFRGWSPDSATITLPKIPPNTWTIKVAISADGRRAVSGIGATVRVWDLGTGGPLRTLADDGSLVRAVAVSADGRRVVSGGDDGTVRVWDLGTGEPLRTLAGHDGPVRAVAVSADGRRVVSGGDDRTVRVWDPKESVELAFFVADSKITELAITPTGTRVIAGTSTGPVHLLELCGYNYASGQPPAQEPRP